MKSYKKISLLSTVLVITLACQAFAQSSTNENDDPAQTDEAALAPPTPDQASGPDQEPTTLPTPILPPTPLPEEGGKWIAFNSRMGGNSDIYMIDTNGENLTQLTDTPDHDFYPSWSPDGTKIIYQTYDGNDQELAIVNVATKEVFQLTDNDCNDWGPVWSLEGWIVFYSDCNSERNIYKIRENGISRTQLTFASGSNSFFPSWSPNGKKITYSSNSTGKYHIYSMNADGTNSVQLAKGCVSQYSPDGTQILYGVYCDDTDALWLMNADGSNQHQITAKGLECKNPTWSPDGTQIVFQLSRTTKDGPFEIYIMSLDKPDKEDWILLTDFDVNGSSPAWQP